MPKRVSRKRDDPAQSAFKAMQRVIDITESKTIVPMRRRKNPAAVELGREGRRNSAKGRMEKIPADERRRIASEAARARWAKEKGDE